MKNKILVLMSTYNGEKYIKEMIDSILNQKDVDVNILIRDDGSKDETVDIIKQYSNRIKLIEGKNKGCTDSFFELIMNAPLEYDYYALCDQDDYWLEEKMISAIEKIKDFSEDSPNLYYSGQIITDQNLNRVSVHNLNTKRTPKANFIFNNMAGCTSVFNKKMLEILKLYYPKNVKGHDNWIYKVCVAFNGNIYADFNSYILYRQHGNNVVGLNNSVKGKVDRAIKQINNINPGLYSKELINGYSSYLANESIDFLNQIINSKKSISSKLKLLFRKDIKFNDISLRIIFIIKLLIGKI